MNKYALAGKVAIVTGASRGIGAATALKLARNGAKVVAAARTLEDCENVVKEVEKLGGEGLACKLDICNEEEIIEVVKKTIGKFGRIDILVNNAGIFVQQELDKMDTSEIDKTLAINLRGVILCTKYVIPEMKRQSYGKIINITSIAGFVGFNQASVYCATKGALVNITKQLAAELGQYKINVNAVAPGVIDTAMTKHIIEDEKVFTALLPMIPYGRIGESDDIANAVAFLASDESEYITGHTVVVDGGWLTT